MTRTSGGSSQYDLTSMVLSDVCLPSTLIVCDVSVPCNTSAITSTWKHVERVSDTSFPCSSLMTYVQLLEGIGDDTPVTVTNNDDCIRGCSFSKKTDRESVCVQVDTSMTLSMMWYLLSVEWTVCNTGCLNPPSVSSDTFPSVSVSFFSIVSRPHCLWCTLSVSSILRGDTTRLCTC